MILTKVRLECPNSEATRTLLRRCTLNERYTVEYYPRHERDRVMSFFKPKVKQNGIKVVHLFQLDDSGWRDRIEC